MEKVESARGLKRVKRKKLTERRESRTKRVERSKRGGSVRDDGARSKVFQKLQMSLDLLARQLPETSGIPKMAPVLLRPWR